MNILTRARNYIGQRLIKGGARIAGIRNISEGVTGSPTPFGTGWNGMQTNAAWMPLNRLQTMLPMERRSTLASSRYLDNNFALVGALNDNSVIYSIGDGIMSHAATDDPDYDSACDGFVAQYFESPDFDIAGEQTMPELTQVLCRGMIVDGDSGAAKILMRDADGLPVGDPQIQLFTSDQIGDGDGKNLMPGERMLQGVGRTMVGRATRYRVLKDSAAPGVQGYWDYRPQDFMLILDRKRIQQNRGMPWCHRATKNGFSMMDLSSLEEAAAYVNALFAAIITTPDGETPEALESFLVQKMSGNAALTEKTEGTPVQKKFVQRFVEIFGGGKIPVFPQGTKLEAYQSARPSTVFHGFTDYLATMIGLSYRIPPSFVWPLATSMSKPDTRKELAQASWYFNYIFLIALRRFYKPTRDFVIEWGLRTGRLNNGVGPRNGASPFQARYHGPRDITIDERYFHKTWLDRLAAGEGTTEEYHALQGQDGMTKAFRRIDEIAKIKARCADRGVLYLGEFKEHVPGSNTGSPAPAEGPDVA